MYQWTRSIDARERQDWEDRLETEELPGLFLEEDAGTGALRVVAVCATREDAQQLAQRFGGEWALQEDRDWVALGAESWRGRWLEVGNRFAVALDDDPRFVAELHRRFPEREVLVIPPEQAFGTGDHETTATCLERVAEFAAGRAQGWSMLDLGTGSGILAIGAYRAGARRVVGTDSDEAALRVAGRNLARNGVPPGGIELVQEDVLAWNPGERFDLVCANLYAGLLQAVIPKLRDALTAGGGICLSGILGEQEPEVSAAIGANRLAIAGRAARGKWVTLWVGERKP